MTEDSLLGVKINVDAKADFSPIIESTPKGLRKLFSLPFARLEARNIRYVALMAAQTEYDRKLIYQGRAVFKDGSVISIETNPSRINNVLEAEEYQELSNLTNNLEMAAEALKSIPDDEVSDKEVDDDFFARWRREAKVIGNEELQRLWGRLLAEEIKCPGSVPFRALDVLKNVSSSEAILFQKIAPYVNDIGIFVCSFKMPPFGITFDDIVVLRDAGLVASFDIDIHWKSLENVNIQGENRVATRFNNFLFVSTGEESEFIMPGFRLSSSGVIASNICDIKPLDLDQIIYLCKSISKYSEGNIKRINVYQRQNDGCFSLVPVYRHL